MLCAFLLVLLAEYMYWIGPETVTVMVMVMGMVMLNHGGLYCTCGVTPGCKVHDMTLCVCCLFIVLVVAVVDVLCIVIGVNVVSVIVLCVVCRMCSPVDGFYSHLVMCVCSMCVLFVL